MVRSNLAGHPVYAQVWKVQVGRVPLYLLDTNIDAELPSRRSRHHRPALRWRSRDAHSPGNLLGIGGYRALQAMGIQPTVCHMNEGHSAFLALEHIQYLMRTRHSVLPRRASWQRQAWFSPRTRRLRPVTTISAPT